MSTVHSICPKCGGKSVEPLHVESNRVEGTTGYRYRCPKCDTVYEIVVSSAGESPRAHPTDE